LPGLDASGTLRKGTPTTLSRHLKALGEVLVAKALAMMHWLTETRKNDFAVGRASSDRRFAREWANRLKVDSSEVSEMTQTFEIYQGIEVPESVLVKLEQKNRYGSVPGLDDEELADPEELERQVMLQEFEAILALPKPPRRGNIKPAVDESGGVDWGAFGTVDFARTRPAFNSSRARARELRGKLKDKLILLAIVKERLPFQAKLVLKYLVKGIITLEHITNADMLAAARLLLEARKLQKELWKAQQASKRHEQRQAERWLEVDKGCGSVAGEMPGALDSFCGSQSPHVRFQIRECVAHGAIASQRC
jgi:hypothetical protein